MKIVLVVSILCGVFSIPAVSRAEAQATQKAYQWTLLMVPQPRIACLEVEMPSGKQLKEVVGSAAATTCPLPKDQPFWNYIFLRDQTDVEKCAEIDFNGQLRRLAPLSYCEPSRKL